MSPLCGCLRCGGYGTLRAWTRLFSWCGGRYREGSTLVEHSEDQRVVSRNGDLCSSILFGVYGKSLALVGGLVHVTAL